MSLDRTPERAADPVSRRDFLRVGGLSVVGLSVAERAALAAARGAADRKSCILLLMTGGPSQFETFDPKPLAPAEVRGPLRAISTAVPGVAFNESLPRLAERAGRFALLRSVWHDAAPIHETGLQILQTGRVARGGRRFPSFGSVIAGAFGPRNDAPPYVVLPRLVRNTGVNAWQGQGAGCLGPDCEPVVVEREEHAGFNGAASPGAWPGGLGLVEEPEAVRRAYGDTSFGRLCLHARQLVERGVRCVTVNLFDTLAGQVTWDCHGRGAAIPATLYEYRDTLGPAFDRAAAALLDDLEQRGLLNDTLVVATGEFGRTPRVNDRGGRDHWPGVWSALVAGGGIEGGQVIGASDREGACPADRPVHAGELTATIYHLLGLESGTSPPLESRLQPAPPEGATSPTKAADLPLVEHAPIAELTGA